MFKNDLPTTLASKCFFKTCAFVLLVGAQPSYAVTINTSWGYEIAALPGAPTPDATSKVIVRAASLLGSVSVGSGRDTGAIDKTTYSLRSKIEGARLLSTVLSDLNVARQSTGQFVNGVALTMRYSDKRGNSGELVSSANLAAKRYEFTKGGAPNGTVPFSVAASDLLMMPYAFIGKPVPLKPAFLAFSDGKAIRQVGLTPKPDTLKIGGATVNAVHLSGTTSAGGFDLWLRAQDGYPLRMRIGLGAKYGVVLDQKALEVPTALVLL